jgi:hypothetical protein
MAITTATIGITSTDLGISLNASTNLSKTGTNTGLEIMDAGYGEVTVAQSAKALLEASGVAADRDTSNYFYLSNKATDETYYLIVKLHDTIIGRLSAGDWMFMPWSQGDGVAEINITATNGTCAYEYAVFKSAYTLIDSTPA